MLKKVVSIASAVVLIFAFTVCSAAGTNTSAQTSAQGQAPQDDGSIRGIITSVSDTQIEIAKMNGGGPGGQQGGQNSQNPPAQPSGSAPQGSPDASGSAPAQASPSSSGSSTSQGTPDTSNMEKVKYTINSSTKIIKQTFSDNGQSGDQSKEKQQPTETEASISDIQTGTMVTITLEEGSTTVAAKIVITEGNGGPGGNPPQGNNNGNAQPSASSSAA